MLWVGNENGTMFVPLNPATPHLLQNCDIGDTFGHSKTTQNSIDLPLDKAEILELCAQNLSVHTESNTKKGATLNLGEYMFPHLYDLPPNTPPQ